MGEPAGRSKAEGEFTQDTSALQPSPGNDDPEDAGDRAGSGTLYNPRQGQAGRGLPFDNKTLERRCPRERCHLVCLERVGADPSDPGARAPGPPPPEEVLGGDEVAQPEKAQADGRAPRVRVTALGVTPGGGCGGQVVHLLCLALQIVSGAHCPRACANCSQGHGSVSHGRPLASRCSVGATGGSVLPSEGPLRGVGDPREAFRCWAGRGAHWVHSAVLPLLW